MGSKRIRKGISKKHNEKLYEGLDVTLINTSTYAEVRIKGTRKEQECEAFSWTSTDFLSNASN